MRHDVLCSTMYSTTVFRHVQPTYCAKAKNGKKCLDKELKSGSALVPVEIVKPRFACHQPCSCDDRIVCQFSKFDWFWSNRQYLANWCKQNACRLTFHHARQYNVPSEGSLAPIEHPLVNVNAVTLKIPPGQMVSICSSGSEQNILEQFLATRKTSSTWYPQDFPGTVHLDPTVGALCSLWESLLRSLSSIPVLSSGTLQRHRFRQRRVCGSWNPSAVLFPGRPLHVKSHGMVYTYTSSTAQGGGGSFKNEKPIGEVSCCGGKMAERTHWWIERWLSVSAYIYISLSLYLSICLSICLCLYPSISLFVLVSNYLCVYVSICLSRLLFL